MNALPLRCAWCGGSRKGKRGRGAGGKVAVFGILKRGGKVYAKVIEDAKTSTLMPIITRKILLDSVVYTDCYRSYNTLDVEGFLHHGINHSTHFCFAALRVLKKNITTSMALKTSGVRQKDTCENTTEYLKNNSPCI